MGKKEKKQTEKVEENLSVLLNKDDLTKEDTHKVFEEATRLYKKEAYEDAIRFYKSAEKNKQYLNLEQQIEIRERLPFCYSKTGQYEIS